jgi:hypothetical protein
MAEETTHQVQIQNTLHGFAWCVNCKIAKTQDTLALALLFVEACRGKALRSLARYPLRISGWWLNH